ncbi:MFS transporter [Starkeya koreensis]|uniref:MFS transporter n=1 Tax=Ancylobacter koreensis TaxID=266121 RepID=A0ABT0DQH7_9HYPH|nr:MFS transporter [Ancylobacter koreensis]MCK0209439.1 MFS transporter [Ancylobacter koreensis]
MTDATVSEATESGAQNGGPAGAAPGRDEAGAGKAATADMARLRTRILVITLALALAAATLLSLRTHTLFKDMLAPEITQKADIVDELATQDIERALGFGIPLDRLVGVEDYLEQLLGAHAEIAYAAVVDPDGKVKFSAGDDPEEIAEELQGPVAGFALGSIDREIVWEGGRQMVLGRAEGPDGNTAAVIVVRLDSRFVDRQFEDLAQDVFIVLLVALFLAFEMAVVLLTGRTLRPLNQLIEAVEAGGQGNLHRRIAYRANDGIGRVVRHFNSLIQGLNERYRRLVEHAGERPALHARVAAIGARFGLTEGPIDSFGIRAAVTDMRLPLFVFVMAEELQKSFLPLYIASLDANVSWLSPQLLISVPISVYMATLALATPISGSWSDRYGPRRIFLAGLMVAIVGFLAAAAAHSVLELIAARAAGAVGYGMCTIAAQGFIVQVTQKEERTQGVSVFVTVLMSASICGTAIGGIIADQLGYRVVFVCAAALALVAGLLALRMMAGVAPTEERRRFRLSDLGIALRNPRFLALVLFAAIPNKIVLTGFLFYAVPLYLAGLNVSEAETARVMILYSLVIVLVGPWVSRVADERGYGWSLVIVGTLLSGLAMFLLAVRSDIYGVAGAVVAVALAHAISISPQIALVPEICADEIERVGQTTVLGALRMLERIGSVIGPMMVAAIAVRFGYTASLMAIGGLIALCAPVLLLAQRGTRRGAER